MDCLSCYLYPFSVLDPMIFPNNFRIHLSTSEKSHLGYVNRVCTESVSQFGISMVKVSYLVLQSANSNQKPSHC